MSDRTSTAGMRRLSELVSVSVTVYIRLLLVDCEHNNNQQSTINVECKQQGTVARLSLSAFCSHSLSFGAIAS